MKMLLATTAILSMAAIGTAAQAQGAATPCSRSPTAVPNNILLADWTGPYDGVPPFDKVTPALFPQAFEFAIAERRREVEAIANNPEAPTFANTIEAYEKSGQRLDRVDAIFGVMTNNMATPEYQALDKEWSPKLSAASDEITLNPKLFQRIKSLYDRKASLGLDAKQDRLADPHVRQLRPPRREPERGAEAAAVGDEPAARRAVRDLLARRCWPTKAPTSPRPKPS